MYLFNGTMPIVEFRQESLYLLNLKPLFVIELHRNPRAETSQGLLHIYWSSVIGLKILNLKKHQMLPVWKLRIHRYPIASTLWVYWYRVIDFFLLFLATNIFLIIQHSNTLDSLILLLFVHLKLNLGAMINNRLSRKIFCSRGTDRSTCYSSQIKESLNES